MFSFPVLVDSRRQGLSEEVETSWVNFGVVRGLARYFYSVPQAVVLSEKDFDASVQLEQRRLERSGRPFIVVRISAPELFDSRSVHTQKRALRVFAARARQTDLIGWIEAGKVLGIICTELGSFDAPLAVAAILEKFNRNVRENFSSSALSDLSVAFDVYPSGTRGTFDFEHLRCVQMVR
jgi:hypothetical protein